MPKPGWLKKAEKEKSVIHTRRYDMCVDCVHYGPLLFYTRHKNKEMTGVHECEAHPGCMNTAYSYSCDDFLHI